MSDAIISIPPSTAIALFKMIRPIIDSLLSCPDSTPFASPVDWRALELWDYVSIVKEPMDLGTARERLDSTVRAAEKSTSLSSGVQEDAGSPTYDLSAGGIKQVLLDIRQTFHNCLLYNAEGSEFHLLGCQFMKRFEARLEKLKRDGGDMFVDEKFRLMDEDKYTEEDDSITLGDLLGKIDNHGGAADRDLPIRISEKGTFSRNLFKIGQEELGYVISVLEMKNASALRDERGGGIEINIDSITPRIFRDLDTYMKQRLGEEGGEAYFDKGGVGGGAGGRGARRGKKRKK